MKIAKRLGSVLGLCHLDDAQPDRSLRIGVEVSAAICHKHQRMRRRHLIALALFVAVVLTTAIWMNVRSPEPTFEAKPLTYWLDELDNSSAPASKAEKAIRTIGTNGIPVLFHLIRAKDPPPFVATMAKIVGVETPYAESSHGKAMRGFELLGTNGCSAVPGLIEILQSNYGDSSVIATLGSLSFIGPAAEPAIPFIVQHIKDPHPLARHNAVQALGEIRGQFHLTIPALTTALTDPVPSVRWCALFALRAHGPRARSAVPEFLKLWSDRAIITNTLGPDRTILTHPIPMTNMVGQALWWIAPEKTPRSFLVGTSIPVVRNGAVALALKADFDGKRETLIVPGSPQPAVAWQHWTKTPQPKITLYLGDDGTDANDVLLGEFRILSVADAVPDVTTGCVIAEGHIFICARDNRRDQFVEVQMLQAAKDSP
jgi:hypothetical protein